MHLSLQLRETLRQRRPAFVYLIPTFQNPSGVCYDEATRAARRARNRAYWNLAELDRDVVERGKYAFRKDEPKAARYRAYRASNGDGADAGETPATK